MKTFDKNLIRFLIVSLCYLDAPITPAHAVAAVAGKIDALPAGGEFVGDLVFIFVLLLITDILGFTKVRSFTRPARK